MAVAGELVLPGGVVTDAEGRFRIDGLGRDRMAVLEISGEKVSFQRVNVATRQMPRVSVPPPGPDGGEIEQHEIHGADCTIAVAPSRPVEGIVRDADTRQPIPGAIVTLFQLAGSTLNIEGLISTVSDGQGRYRLVGMPGRAIVGAQNVDQQP